MNKPESKNVKKRSETKSKDPDTTTLLKKIKNIQKTTAFLRVNLELERQQLEQIRFSSYPLNMAISATPSYPIYPKYEGVPQYFTNPAPDWPQLGLIQQQQQQQHMAPMVPYGYSITHPVGPPRYVKSMPPSNYVSELEYVDKACKKELLNMRRNMRSLRQMSHTWGKRSDSSSSLSSGYDKGRVRRRRRRCYRKKVYKWFDTEEEDEY